jgi:hypothetical protein
LEKVPGPVAEKVTDPSGERTMTVSLTVAVQTVDVPLVTEAGAQATVVVVGSSAAAGGAATRVAAVTTSSAGKPMRGTRLKATYKGMMS